MIPGWINGEKIFFIYCHVSRAVGADFHKTLGSYLLRNQRNLGGVSSFFK